MNIAIPVLDGRISPLLDTSGRLLLVTRRGGKDLERKEIALGLLPPQALVDTLAGLQVSLVLCAALSGALLHALRRRRIRVRSHLCGPVEAILRASSCGRLDREEFRMPGCRGHHRDGECLPSRRPARSRLPQDKLTDHAI